MMKLPDDFFNSEQRSFMHCGEPPNNVDLALLLEEQFKAHGAEPFELLDVTIDVEEPPTVRAHTDTVRIPIGKLKKLCEESKQV